MNTFCYVHTKVLTLSQLQTLTQGFGLDPIKQIAKSGRFARFIIPIECDNSFDLRVGLDSDWS